MNGRPPVHGERRVTGSGTTPEYLCWKGMLYRCRSKEKAKARVYRDRGITVCDEWKCSFKTFLDHVGRKPSPKHTLDRVDNEKGYCPGNVRWALPREQSNNRRDTILEVNGIRKSFFEWSKVYGVPQRNIRMRVASGWDPKAAISHPLFRSGPRSVGISRAGGTSNVSLRGH